MRVVAKTSPNGKDGQCRKQSDALDVSVELAAAYLLLDMALTSLHKSGSLGLGVCDDMTSQMDLEFRAGSDLTRSMSRWSWPWPTCCWAAFRKRKTVWGWGLPPPARQIQASSSSSWYPPPPSGLCPHRCCLEVPSF